MVCDCKKVERTNLWTPIPEGKCCQSKILPGENVDCYAKRAGTNGKDDAGPKIKNTVDNTSLSSDTSGNVNEKLGLTPNSDKTAASWKLTCNGQPGLPAGMGLTFNESTGALTGKVADEFANKQYKIKATAYSDSSEAIDSREFNFYPKNGKGDDEVLKFVWPLSPKGVVTSTFGPRERPCPQCSSAHNGIDIANPQGSPGTILAAGDGTVVRCGPGSGWGNVIFIEHRDSKGDLVATTVYGHWEKTFVAVGQKVSAGQKIAIEGNAGASTGHHLHFECHKGSMKNPCDPMAFLNGRVDVAQNNQSDGKPAPDSFKSVEKSNQGMTSGESKAAQQDDCPKKLNNQAGDPGQPPLSKEPSSAPEFQNNKDSQAQVNKALDEDKSLSEEDKKYLKFVAGAESDFKADAKNPNSSARGIFQMTDKTAEKYFKQIGVEPTEENRNNPYYATKAQVEFYKNEQLKYWNEFNASKANGNPTLAGKPLSPDLADRYSRLTQGEFMYGLIHHDGVGNAVNGKDMQGVDYYRKRMRGLA